MDVRYVHLVVESRDHEPRRRTLMNETSGAAEMAISALQLSIRAQNIIRKMHIDNVAQLCAKNQENFLRMENCGRKTLAEIEDALAKLGLGLNIIVDGPSVICPVCHGAGRVSNQIVFSRDREAAELAEELSKYKITRANFTSLDIAKGFLGWPQRNKRNEEIFLRYEGGESAVELGEEFNLSRARVYQLVEYYAKAIERAKEEVIYE